MRKILGISLALLLSTGLALAATNGVYSNSGGSGGSTSPGGTSGQIEYNNSGSFGGFTVSGDGTINTSTGVMTNTGINGVAVTTSLASGTHTITSTSATALAVGPNGVTNDVLSVDASTASAVGGIVIKGNGTGVATTITATDSGANAPLSIITKGTGVLTLNGGNGNTIDVAIQTAATNRLTVAPYASAFTPGIIGTVFTGHFTYTGPADTAITTATESLGVSFNNAAIRQWTAGTVALQEEFKIAAPTYAQTAAGTFTEAATLSVTGAPIAGTNATITQSEAIRVGSGTIALENGGTLPTVSTGTAATGSGTHKGVVTGLSAATALTVTFAAGQPLPAPQVCTAIGGTAGAISGLYVSAISATAVTFTFTSYTGSLYYHCF